jgi:multiple antibiotic resistance protein
VSDAFELFLRLLVIFNPPGLALVLARLEAPLAPAQRVRLRLATISIAVTLAVIAGVLGDELIDLLGISLASFQIAAGVLLLVGALRRLLDRDPFAVELLPPSRWGTEIAALRAALSVVTPAAFAAIAFYGAETRADGSRYAGDVSIGVLGALVVTLLVAEYGSQRAIGRYQLALREVGRLLLVVLVVLAVDLVVDGVEAV